MRSAPNWLLVILARGVRTLWLGWCRTLPGISELVLAHPLLVTANASWILNVEYSVSLNCAFKPASCVELLSSDNLWFTVKPGLLVKSTKLRGRDCCQESVVRNVKLVFPIWRPF